MREGAVADPRHARIGPHPFVRRSRERDDVQRQRDFAHHAFNLFRVAEPGNEKSACSGIGEGLAAFDDLIDQRVVIGLGFEEQVGPRVDEELIADRAADCRDTPYLEVERVEAFAADDLVLEIAADSPGGGEPCDVRSAFRGICCAARAGTASSGPCADRRPASAEPPPRVNRLES